MRKHVIVSMLLFLSIVSLGEIGLGIDRGMRGTGRGTGLLEDRNRVGRLLALLDSERVKASLGLTNPQVERLRQIFVETEKADVKVLADIAVRGIELRESLRADKPDRDKILKQVQDISALRGEMMRLNVEAILSAKTVLSAEQQRKAFSLFENLRESGLTEGQGGDSGATSPPKASPPPEIPLHPGEPPVQ